MTNTTTKFLDIGGSQLAYHQTGDGPDVLFIHGWPLHRATWRDLAANLPDATCHLVDMPGCGESKTPDDVAVSLLGHVDVMVELVKSLDTEQIVLVGQDSGGLVARIVAAQLPGHIAGLVLIDTEIPGLHLEIIDQLQTVAKVPGAAAAFRKALASPSITRSKRVFGGFFWDRDLLEGSFRTEVINPSLASPDYMDRQFEILTTFSHDIVDGLKDAHAQITCPTLLIWGADDPFFPPAKARAMAEQFAGPTRFVEVPNAAVLVHEEHPQRVAELIRELLDDIG